MAFERLDALRSAEEVAAVATELKAEIEGMDREAAGRPFSEEERDRFASLKAEYDEAQERLAEFAAREAVIIDLSEESKNVERPNFRRPGAVRTADIYDLTPLRGLREEERKVELNERAKRSVDTSSFPDEGAAERVEGLLDNHDQHGEIARRILVTGSPAYKRGFAKYIAGTEPTSEERTALGLAGTAGGYAVPYVVDPTVVLTSDGVINPVRQLARVIQITGNHWTGIASSGISASYDAEAAEVSDDSPAFSQPTADVEMARAFVQYSMEVDDDWGALQAEIARMFADAKDTLESSKFLIGLGHSSNQPEGLLVGATGTVVTATASSIAVADIYSLEEALAPRWRSRASFVGGLAVYNKIRQFDTGGGASLWVQLAYDQPATLLGKRAVEWSDYSGAITTGGSSVLTYGDFNEFTIIDRVGMSVEVVPHMFATANNLPSGQRGLFARWRNTSDVRTAAAFKTLKIKS